MSCVCKIKCMHWNAAILLYFLCFIFIFMTTLISSKPISNICRACKLSNLAQQLGEGGGGKGMHDCYFKPSPKHKTRWGAPKHMYPLPFFPNNILLWNPLQPPPPPIMFFIKKKILPSLQTEKEKWAKLHGWSFCSWYNCDLMSAQTKKTVCISWHIFFLSLERTYMYSVTKFPFSCVRNMSWMANCFGKS